MPRVIVVGGGISGLALAYRLEQRLPAAEVLVLEQGARLGGTIDTIEQAGFRVEAGPNGFLGSNPATLDLAGEIGLGERLVAASESAGRNRFLLLAGRLYALPGGLFSFLGSDVLSWLGKLHLLAERFRPRRRSCADESIHAFARRRVGREVADTLVDAFVTGIFAGDPKLLSVQATFPRLAGYEREHGSVLGGLARARKQRRASAAPAGSRPGQMWSFREGLRLLVETLAGRLRRPPLTGVGVRRLRRVADGWEVTADGRDAWRGEAVVLACPAYAQARLLADEDAALAERVAGIAYNRIAVVALGYRSADVPPLDGFGYLSPQRSRRDVLGVQWCSSIFPERAPPGMVLLRAMCGGWHRPEVVDWPEERLLAAVRGELATVLRIRAMPVFHQVVRWDRAIPQYHLGHLERLAWIEERLARHGGLFLGGNAYRGVALNDCVEQAGQLAERVQAWLQAAPPLAPLAPDGGARGRG
jgi:oxygen-dependent protoporphyrinogen oxidase